MLDIYPFIVISSLCPKAQFSFNINVCAIRVSISLVFSFNTFFSHCEFASSGTLFLIFITSFNTCTKSCILLTQSFELNIVFIFLPPGSILVIAAEIDSSQITLGVTKGIVTS